jgi:hypothetical protein
MTKFAKIALPTDLLASSLGLRNDYADCYRADGLDPRRVPGVDRVVSAFFSDAMPLWIRRLLSLRNRIVARFGLKTGASFVVSALPAEISVGGLVGPWHVVSRDGNEIVFRENDKHLDFAFSLRVSPERGSIDATTIVQFHGLFGRVYFCFVKPFHKLIVPRHMEKVLAVALGGRCPIPTA